MKGKMKECYKKGGAVKEKAHKKEEKHEKAEKHEKKEKKAHKVHGEHAKHRLDKKARGGKISTPTSPLSGAYPKGTVAKCGTDKEND